MDWGHKGEAEIPQILVDCPSARVPSAQIYLVFFELFQATLFPGILVSTNNDTFVIFIEKKNWVW